MCMYECVCEEEGIALVYLPATLFKLLQREGAGLLCVCVCVEGRGSSFQYQGEMVL